MKRIIILVAFLMSSCWLKENNNQRNIPIVSYSDKSEVLLDSLLVKKIVADRGMISLNSRIHVLGGYLTQEVSNSSSKSFWLSIEKGDSIFFHLEENSILVDKNDGGLFHFRKMVKSDYKWYDDWW